MTSKIWNSQIIPSFLYEHFHNIWIHEVTVSCSIILHFKDLAILTILICLISFAFKGLKKKYVLLKFHSHNLNVHFQNTDYWNCMTVNTVVEEGSYIWWTNHITRKSQTRGLNILNVNLRQSCAKMGKKFCINGRSTRQTLLHAHHHHFLLAFNLGHSGDWLLQ